MLIPPMGFEGYTEETTVKEFSNEKIVAEVTVYEYESEYELGRHTYTITNDGENFVISDVEFNWNY